MIKNVTKSDDTIRGDAIWIPALCSSLNSNIIVDNYSITKYRLKKSVFSTTKHGPSIQYQIIPRILLFPPPPRKHKYLMEPYHTHTHVQRNFRFRWALFVVFVPVVIQLPQNILFKRNILQIYIYIPMYYVHLCAPPNENRAHAKHPPNIPTIYARIFRTR